MKLKKSISASFLTLVLLLQTSVSVAQSKEETVAFITKCMQEAVGLKQYAILDDKRVEEYVLTDIQFSGGSLSSKYDYYHYVNGTYKQNKVFTNLSWGNVTKIELDTLPSKFHDHDQAVIYISFSSNYTYKSTYLAGSYKIGENSTTYYWGRTVICIPMRRAKACEKAFHRLVEIYKEEDKSPFDE